MRVIATIAVVAAVVDLCSAPPPVFATEPASTVAIFWQPPGDSSRAIAATVRAAFAEAVAPLHAHLVDASTPAPKSPSLLPALMAAKSDYARFAFTEAIARFDELQRSADAQGGGDLDGRQLSEIFLYRGLCRLETGRAEAAWDDLVTAARLDPTRIVDPALYPPRAVAAYSRAVAEVAKLPRAVLVVDAPAAASVRVDGASVSGPVEVTLGQHFVAVAADGFEPWAGVESVTGARERMAPPLHPFRPPDGDRLLALAGDALPRQLLLGALERTEAGWRFVFRDVTLPDGKFVSDTVALGDAPSGPAVSALVRRLVPATASATVSSTARSTTPPVYRRWWPWVVAAVGVAAVAVGVSVGVLYGVPQPNVSGAFDLH